MLLPDFFIRGLTPFRTRFSCGAVASVQQTYDTVIWAWDSSAKICTVGTVPRLYLAQGNLGEKYYIQHVYSRSQSPDECVAQRNG